MPEDPQLRRLLWYLIGGSRGGYNRARVILALKERPLNLNKMAEKLGVNYKAVQHHARGLQKNGLIVTSGEKYGLLYFLSPYLEANYSMFEEIWSRVGTK